MKNLQKTEKPKPKNRGQTTVILVGRLTSCLLIRENNRGLSPVSPVFSQRIHCQGAPGFLFLLWCVACADGGQLLVMRIAVIHSFLDLRQFGLDIFTLEYLAEARLG